jgi:hypothetical protein
MPGERLGKAGPPSNGVERMRERSRSAAPLGLPAWTLATVSGRPGPSNTRFRVSKLRLSRVVVSWTGFLTWN